jgi:alpha-ketoglutarate-dependent taurine dioxygenase
MAHIRPIGGKIGVEVSGVDVRRLDDDGFAPIYRAWLDHGVMVVTGQDLTKAEFLTYSRRFGLITPHPSRKTRDPDHPEITLLGVGKFDADGKLIQAIYRRGAEGWHTDGAYAQTPFKATQLYALAIPDTGGDTLFACGYAAWQALPQRLKERLEGVRGAFGYSRTTGFRSLLNPEDQDAPPALHPVLNVHPETGRRSLYFDPTKIISIDGVEKNESDDLIAELETYMIQPDAQYRHKWRVGDIVIWDNRCAFHKAAGDYPPDQDRFHWRVSIQEPAPLARREVMSAASMAIS